MIRFEQDSSAVNYNQYGIESFTFLHVIDDYFYSLSVPSRVIRLRGKEVAMCRSPRYRQVLSDPNAQILDPPGQSAFDVLHFPSSSSLLFGARCAAIHILPPTSAPEPHIGAPPDVHLVTESIPGPLSPEIRTR